MRQALISVTNKEKLTVIASAFQRHNVGILSTSGTAKVLRENHFDLTDISAYTEYPELFGGRLKTIHPKLAGGYLYQRDESVHIEQASHNSIDPIDFVVVNLYEFERTIAKPDTTLATAIENIDIGGPMALRAAAKNYESVTVIVDPSDYLEVTREMDQNEGETTLRLRFRLACKVFRVMKAYETAISDYLDKQPGSGIAYQKIMPTILQAPYSPQLRI